MIHGYHHVGLAVNNIEEAAKYWQEVFGAEFSEPGGLETPEFYSRMIKVGSSLVELLEPRGKDGLIEKFISTRGEGIHHISFRVDDPEEVFKKYDEKGIRTLRRRFIHPKSSHGVLIEIIGLKS